MLEFAVPETIFTASFKKFKFLRKTIAMLCISFVVAFYLKRIRARTILDSCFLLGEKIYSSLAASTTQTSTVANILEHMQGACHYQFVELRIVRRTVVQMPELNRHKSNKFLLDNVCSHPSKNEVPIITWISPLKLSSEFVTNSRSADGKNVSCALNG